MTNLTVNLTVKRDALLVGHYLVVRWFAFKK